ncbi:hypothetical protein N9N67_10980 [Bacteriovoracaceae bacterium]|nr:hypothetical protein [Bacteriovoracaceae bacterium]
MEKIIKLFIISIISILSVIAQDVALKNDKLKSKEEIIEAKLKKMKNKNKIIDKKVMYNGIIQAKTNETEEARDIYNASRQIASTLDKKNILIITNDPLTLEFEKAAKGTDSTKD